MINHDTFIYIQREVRFTPQQNKVLRCLAQGMKYKDITQELNVTSKAFTSNVMRHIRNKTGLKAQEDIIAYARENGYGEVGSEEIA